MKPPRFWQQIPPPFWTIFLRPFAQITLIGGYMRQKCIFRKKLPLPIICCGSVTVGGSGKTPLSRELALLLIKKGFNPHFLTRGYGRKKTFFTKTLYVDSDHFPVENRHYFGDEPLLLAKTAPCWIDSNRKRSAALAAKEGADCLILDDGFQSNALEKDLNLLLFKGENPIGNGHILPAGPLRESLKQALKRADFAFIVGKDSFNLRPLFKKAGIPAAQVFLSPASNILASFAGCSVCAFAGIAFPEDFFAMLRRYGLNLKQGLSFPDHHIYTQADIKSLSEIAQKMPVLTTEKDAVKFPEKIQKQFVVIPVEIIWSSESEKELLFQLLQSKYGMAAEK